MFGMADIDSHKLFCLRASMKPTRGHGFKLVQEQFETQRRRSFFLSTCCQCLEQFASFYTVSQKHVTTFSTITLTIGVRLQ